ncbi:MAG: hypothetical protein ABI665_12825 [Vicinamibacterales bacterium]
MTSIRKFTLGCIVAAAALPMTAQAQGGLPNQDTYFQFSAPVEVPGATLPAGRYLFVLADSPSNRHVVRVMSDDRKKTFATVMAIPSYSVSKPSDEPEIRFMESPANSPHAVKLWVYPGRTVGHEFLYPRAQATRLAKMTGEPVLTVKTDSPVSDTVAETDMTRIDRDGHDATVSGDTRPIDAELEIQRGTRTAEQAAQATPPAQPAPTPRTEPTATMADRTPAPPARVDRTDQTDRTELPRTATILPLITLIGAGAMAAGNLLRRSRRSRA